MRWSQTFIPTLRDDPADAEVVSHRLLLRAGYIRQLSAGIYSYLPLAKRVINKIERILREEMNAIGGQEFFLPALNPKEIWEESGRWSVMGDNMFRLKDRKGADLCLGMTHEEVFTSIARNELRSYKQLPQVWYQIQTKFRDEPRPKSGLLRVRQFIMKDAYSFDVNWEGLDKSFNDQREAYKKIFDRCGLKYSIVEASSGSMGGSQSNEFMVKTDAGEDLIATCENCGYAANLEKATSRLQGIPQDVPFNGLPEKFPTPGVRTIEDLTKPPFNVATTRQIKTLVYVANMPDGRSEMVLALLRGDHQLHETKLQDAIGATLVRPAQDDEIRTLLGASAGSLGAFIPENELRRGKGDFRVILDKELLGRHNLVTGANEDGFHYRGVNVARDIESGSFEMRGTSRKFADLRVVTKGERCPNCDLGILDVFKALEIGHIFKLGLKYSESMGASVLNAEGKEVPIVMGSYGIGVERIMAAAIELHHDEQGIVFPRAIAPFDVVVTITNIKQDEILGAGEKIYAELQRAGFDVLFDERDERAGVKFKDADLIGIPFRITVGKKIREGVVELFNRKTKEVVEVKVEDTLARLRDIASI